MDDSRNALTDALIAVNIAWCVALFILMVCFGVIGVIDILRCPDRQTATAEVPPAPIIPLDRWLELRHKNLPSSPTSLYHRLELHGRTPNISSYKRPYGALFFNSKPLQRINLCRGSSFSLSHLIT